MNIEEIAKKVTAKFQIDRLTIERDYIAGIFSLHLVKNNNFTDEPIIRGVSLERTDKNIIPLRNGLYKLDHFYIEGKIKKGNSRYVLHPCLRILDFSTDKELGKIAFCTMADSNGATIHIGMGCNDLKYGKRDIMYSCELERNCVDSVFRIRETYGADYYDCGNESIIVLKVNSIP